MVNDALNELFPFIDVETLSLELQYLSTWRPGFGSINHAASAGNLNHAQIFNPAESGMILVVTRVDIRVASTGIVRYEMTGTPATLFPVIGQLRDTRTSIADRPVGQVRNEVIVGGLAAIGQWFLLTNVQDTMADPRGLFVLVPGTGVTFATTLANIASTVNFFWKERVAEPAELNF